MKKIFFVFIVLFLTGNVFAAQMRFSRRTDWGTLGNWTVFVSGSWVSATALPTLTDELSYLANPTIAVGTNAYAGWSPVGSGRTITINGTYTSGNRMSIGNGEGSIGTITVNAGGVLHNEERELYVNEANGIGVLNVSGTVYAGAIDILVSNAGSGTVNVLPGGVVDVNGRVTVGDRVPASTGTAALIISPGGLVRCTENWGDMDRAVADGRIRATDGAGIVVTNHTSDAGKTFIAIVPPNTWDPYPAENQVITSTTPTLNWKGGNAVSYDVYFGTDINNIASARRLAGDFNNDRTVDMADMTTFVEQWLTTPAASIFSSDFDASGTVDMNDFARLAGNWQAAADADYKGNQTAKTYTITSPLSLDTTYYWRVDTIDDNNQLNIGEIWRFNCDVQPMTELLTDPSFQHGLKVYSPELTQEYEGVLKWNDSWQQPSWTFGQLASMTDIMDANAEQLASGSYRWETATKAVVMGPTNSTDADVITMVDTRDEYMHFTPPYWWPHTFYYQNFESPWLTEMSELWYNLDVRLVSDQQWYDPNATGATFLYVGITLQDLNPASPGYGDMVWMQFGVYRSTIPNRLDQSSWIIEGDIGPGGGLGKLIYFAGSLNFTAPDATFIGGDWVNFHGDLVPFMYDALEEAWSRGFLPNSHDPNNFKFDGFGPTWESSYRSRVELQLRNFSLRKVDIAPADGAAGIGLTPTLRWPAGSGAASYDVYFGTSLSDVNNATQASAEFQGNQTDRTYVPDTLSESTTYYWRIDEVGDGGTTKGTVWSFTTLSTLFSDGFESGDFATGGWTAQTGGNATVTTDANDNGTYGAKLAGGTWMQKAVSTANLNTIHVKYNRTTTGMSPSEELYVEWSINGTTWNTLEATHITSWTAADFVCDAGANNNANFRVRFRTNGNLTSKYAYIDDVVITGSGQ